MRNRLLGAALGAALAAAAPIGADAGPINSYPAAATPLSGSETVIGTQSGSTVQITAQSIANLVYAATSAWIGVQTFPAPGASKGSIVLTPGTVSGTPPNGSLWTTSTGLFAEIGGSADQFPALSGANTWTGVQTFPAPGAGTGSVVLTPGTISGTPANGSLWTTSSGLFAEIGGSAVQFQASGSGVTQTGSVIAGDCVKWSANTVVMDAGVVCGGGSGSGVPGGSNSSVQFNNAGNFGGSAFLYATPGSIPTLTGPDSTTWGSAGITIGASSALNINGTVLLSGSAPVMYAPVCSSGAGGATWLIGPGSSYCTHTTSGATDNICLGTIVCGGNGSITSAFGNTVGGSEDEKNLTSGSNNTAWGFEANHLITSGGSNTGIGSNALDFVTTGSSNIGLGQSGGAGVSTGSSNVCIYANCGANNTMTGSNNVMVGGGATTITSGSRNVIVGPTNSAPGQGIVAGHGNVWIGGQGTTLADQSDSVTLADGDGNALIQYQPANGIMGVSQPVLVTGFLRIATTTVSGLSTADPSPTAGDRAFVTDAAACTFGSTLTGGSSTKCPVYYDGAAWRAG